MKLSTLFLVSILLGFSNSSHAQESRFFLSSELFGTRFMIGHHIGIKRAQNRWLFGLSLGYNPDRLYRFRHFSGQLKLSASRNILKNEMLHVDCHADFLATHRNYPSNANVQVFSMFGGYGLSYGKRIQFIQSLSLGTSCFYETTQDVKPFFAYDFKVMFGIRYLINQKNGHEI